jgi:type IV pilus assembly protein PilM
MEFLPRTLGTRPRLACEVRAEGVVAARAEDASAVLTAVSQVALASGVAIPHLRSGEVAETGAGAIGNGVIGRGMLVAAIRKVLEDVSQRTRDVTLVVPDAAVRVLLLEFDSLPAKAAEALPLVRFRLKKLLPFDADDAAVSYQVMATSRGTMQVLAVAMPNELQAEYEAVVREAGFEPGAVLPSTLAALAGLEEREIPTLIVNAGRDGVTTAIVKAGVLLLHRMVDLADGAGPAGSAVAAEPVDTSISAIAARMAALENRVPVREPEVVVEASVAAPKNEIGQAVSVAAAYFEDTLQSAPAVVLAAGPLGAETLTAIIDETGVGIGPVAVQEMVERQMLGDGAASAGSRGGLPLGWLAGVRGALSN